MPNQVGGDKRAPRIRSYLWIPQAGRHALPGSRPKTDEAIARFVEDHTALWKLAKASKQLSIEFPTKGVGKKTAEFEVGGLDPKKLPKWN